jgi:hypothetical protein
VLPALALTTAGCVHVDTGPADDICHPERVRGVVGRAFTPELGRWIRQRSGARIFRALRPGDMVTAEYMVGRLDIMLDEQGRITGLDCG